MGVTGASSMDFRCCAPTRFAAQSLACFLSRRSGRRAGRRRQAGTHQAAAIVHTLALDIRKAYCHFLEPQSPVLDGEGLCLACSLLQVALKNYIEKADLLPDSQRTAMSDTPGQTNPTTQYSRGHTPCRSHAPDVEQCVGRASRPSEERREPAGSGPARPARVDSCSLLHGHAPK